jgi:catechol 2,3-dioxygenase-like lactoylglutathione lyase family enzyme
MEQRISLVTLGIADLARARAFYEALGWRGAKRLSARPGGRWRPVAG